MLLKILILLICDNDKYLNFTHYKTGLIRLVILFYRHLFSKYLSFHYLNLNHIFLNSYELVKEIRYQSIFLYFNFLIVSPTDIRSFAKVLLTVNPDLGCLDVYLNQNYFLFSLILIIRNPL